MNLSSTKVSSKGQVVIPLEVREQLGLKSGDQLLCGVADGRIVLIPAADERLRDLEDLFAWGSRIAKVRGIRRRDVERAASEARYGKK